MAVDALKSTQLTPGTRLYPVDDGGKFRLAYFSFVAAVASDANSTLELVKLPQGRKRIILPESKLWTSAFGAARVMKIGHRAYTNSVVNGASGIIAEDDDALFSGLDISAALNNKEFSAAAPKFDIFSVGAVTLFATVTGGTIPLGATVSGYVAYVTE